MSTYTESNHADKNNLLSGTAGSMEALLRTGSRYDFGMKWAGTDGAVSVDASPNQPSVGLVQGVFPMNPDFGAQAYKNGAGWDSGPAAVSIDWAPGTLAGSIKELYYACTFDAGGLVSARSLVATRDNVDPGSGSIGVGRKGQEYSFALTGLEFRVYNGREAAPVLILASPTQGFGFPLSLGAWVVGNATDGFNVENIRIAGGGMATIYSSRDQAADGISSGLHLRIYEIDRIGTIGVPVDIDI